MEKWQFSSFPPKTARYYIIHSFTGKFKITVFESTANPLERRFIKVPNLICCLEIRKIGKKFYITNAMLYAPEGGYPDIY